MIILPIGKKRSVKNSFIRIGQKMKLRKIREDDRSDIFYWCVDDIGDFDRVVVGDDPLLVFYLNGKKIAEACTPETRWALYYGAISTFYLNDPCEIEENGKKEQVRHVICADPRVCKLFFTAWQLVRTSPFYLTNKQIEAVVNYVPEMDEARSWLISNNLTPPTDKLVMRDFETEKFPPDWEYMPNPIKVDFEELKKIE